MSYQYLAQPGHIGSMTVKNRMAVSAMGTNLAEEDGSCGQRLIDFHERQARGGVGLIIMGVAGVAWPDGGNMPRQVAISDDRFIDGLSAMAEAVHAHDAKVVTQLHHGGLVAAQDTRDGRPVWVPSYPVNKQGNFLDGLLHEEMAAMFNADAPPMQLHVVTQEDIKLIVGKFVDRV